MRPTGQTYYTFLSELPVPFGELRLVSDGAALTALGLKKSWAKFGHAAEYTLPGGATTISPPSQPSRRTPDVNRTPVSATCNWERSVSGASGIAIGGTRRQAVKLHRGRSDRRADRRRTRRQRSRRGTGTDRSAMPAW